MVKKTVIITMLILALAALSFGQGSNRGGQRPYYNANRIHDFDVTKPVDINGEITKVETVQAQNNQRGTGVHLTVAHGDTQSVVSLGPSFYLDAQNQVFKKGEKIQLKAYPGIGSSNGLLFAASLNHGGKALLLRDADGYPLWRRSLNRQGRWGRRGKGRRGGRPGYGRGMGRRLP